MQKFNSSILDLCKFFIVLHPLSNADFERNAATVDNNMQHYKLIISFKSLKQENDAKKEDNRDAKSWIKQS